MIWDKLAKYYDFFETAYNGKCFKGIAEEITNYVGIDDIVLECACGTGLLTLPMAKSCKKLVATDLSVEMLKQTKKKVQQYPNVRLKRSSITEIPFDDGRFDVVVAANVIHLLDDPDLAISEMKRVCKKGGRIVIPTYINATHKSSIVAEKLLGMLGVDFQKEFDIVSYMDFFSERGIKDVQYRIVEGRMPCAFATFENK